MPGISIRLLVFVTAALAAVPLPAPAQWTSSEPVPSSSKGQAFPPRPVKIIVPTSPGGATDAFSRALAPRLAETWGQPVLVENRPGANQILGADYVSKSAPDGATLLVSDASSFVINPHLYKKLPYDGLSGFTPITMLVRFPWVIAVHASVPANTFQELVALAKAKAPSAWAPRRTSAWITSRTSSASISCTCPTRARDPRSPICFPAGYR